MTESLIGTGALFHKAVNPAVVVEPVETPFHFPTLTRITGLDELQGHERGIIVPAPRNTGVNVPCKEQVTERIAVVSFVRADPSGKSDVNAINRADSQ